ncbi:DUF4326 domain-containing protein [Spirosoma migulaei]
MATIEIVKPIRVQRKRTKGFKLPAGTVCVTRPGKWSNPFTVEEETVAITQKAKEAGFVPVRPIEKQARNEVVTKFHDMIADPYSHHVMPEIRERFIYMREHLEDLTGKNLACFCSLDQRCHADILLKLANPE